MPSFQRRNCIRKPNAACDASGRLRKPPLAGRTVVQSLRTWYVTQTLRFSSESAIQVAEAAFVETARAPHSAKLSRLSGSTLLRAMGHSR